MVVSLALLAMVLASRSISWAMKSSLRPSPPEGGPCPPRRCHALPILLLADGDELIEVAAEPGDFLGDVRAVGEEGDFLEQIVVGEGQLGVGDHLIDARAGARSW